MGPCGIATPSIYLTRLDANGNKLGGDTLVSTGTVPGGQPVIVWTGSEYGVVWDQCPATNCSSSEIWFGRVSAAGVRLGTPRTISATAGQASDPHMVWSGGAYWIVWEVAETSITRLDATGATVLPPQQATTVTSGAISPKIVATFDRPRDHLGGHASRPERDLRADDHVPVGQPGIERVS